MQYLVKVKCHFLWQVQYFCEVPALLFVAGAVLGEGQVSLFVAGAALGEGLNVRLGAKRCILQKKMLLVSSKSNLTCEAGCGLSVSCSDHARIILGSFSDRLRIGNDVSAVFRKFLPDVGWSFCVAGAVFGEVGS